jgi:hypothetical protein
MNDSTNSKATDLFPHSSQQQGFGYRRGFVLGLTLAEATLLLLFVVMLLLVIGFDRRDRLIAENAELERAISELVPPNTEPVTYIEESLSQFAEIQNIASAAGQEWDEDFIELVRAVAEASRGEEILDVSRALEEKSEQLNRMIELIQKIETGTNIEEIITRNSDQEAEINNQRGQIVDLRARLGSGVFPSCWTRDDGGFDYILDVVLASEGIRIRESVSPERIAERERLPLTSIVDPTRVYGESEFLSTTQALYNWSVDHECRFYVTIYDGTQAFEKDLYKDLMRTVEGHFYKRQLTDASPF